MKRLELPTRQALGHYLAHTLRTSSGVIRKGRHLDRATIARLLRAGAERLQVLQLEPGDLHEDEAAARLARPLLDDGMILDIAGGGRCNLVASRRGLLQIQEARVHALNDWNETLTLATLPPWSVVERGQVVASVKVIPFALPADSVEGWLELLRDAPALPLRLHRFNTLPVALLRTHSEADGPVPDSRLEQLTARRLAYYGCVLSEVRYCDHSPGALARELEQLKGRCRLVLVAGHSATLDREDVLPTGVELAGGEIRHLGLPVEPGNLLLYGYLEQTPLIGLPGCARSAALNGLDLLLPRLAAGLSLQRQDLTRLGVGGLLGNRQREFSQQSLRPVAHNGPGRETPASITALVLAAGRSKRMGRNKLLLPLEGRPMIQHTLDALQGCRLAGITLVSGHQSLRLRDQLQNHPLYNQLQIVNNPDYGSGLASSLRQGLKQLPAGHGGLLLLLGDMPMLSPALVQKLLARFHELNGEKIIIPCYRGQRGHPRVWPAPLVPMMSLAQGDRGADFLIRQNPAWIEELELDDPAVIRDFDTPEALAQWQP